jgi:alanine-glyoxylate transaminase / serine-glyoxylate transaminase / serine-pyruvate transaminase
MSDPAAIRDLNTPLRLLMGPGPSDVHHRVLRAMATPLVGHLDPSFLKIMDEIRGMLQAVLRTKNPLTFAVSGTGSAGMEACLANLIEPGDAVAIGVNGVFGTRMTDVAARLGATVHRIDAPWGRIIEPGAVAQTLKQHKVKLVAVVHAETSTGVRQPLEEIGRLAREHGALFLVDAVTSLGGIDLHVDDWGIDALYSGTQKCLSCPPGLAPVTFGPRAEEAMSRRKTKCASWYLDVSMLRNYWGEDRAYHHTAPITMLYALRESLRLVLEEGLEPRFERHRRHHELLKSGLEAMGFEFVVAPEHRLPQLNAVKFPAGVDDAGVRRRLLEDYSIEIGAGLGEFKGKVWRIGLMGASSTPNHVNSLLAALKEILG